MELNVENIKALDPGKIYVVSVDASSVNLDMMVEQLVEIARQFSITFLFIDKDTMEIVSAPKGLKVVKEET